MVSCDLTQALAHLSEDNVGAEPKPLQEASFCRVRDTVGLGPAFPAKLQNKGMLLSGLPGLV